MAQPTRYGSLKKRWATKSVLTRKDINAFISECTKKLELVGPYTLDVAMGGRASASGVYQGYDVERFQWSGDLMPLTDVRKVALPGDLLDIYVNDHRSGDLVGNVFIRIPYPELDIPGQCGWY